MAVEAYKKSASAMCSEAIYSLGYSLMDGEVLSGEDVYSIGRTMLRAAGDIEMNSRARQFVVNNCEAIIDILKGSGKIFNG